MNNNDNNNDDVMDEDDYFTAVPDEVDNNDEKIQVDKRQLSKTPFDSVIEPNIWSGLKPLTHMGIIGATSAGKTFFFKNLLADEKIPICDMYIIVAELNGQSELVKGFCTLEYLSNGSYANKKYYHFLPTDIEQAFALTLSEENNNYTKCLFLSDCLITNNTTKTKTANYINKAKNFKTTVIVEIHQIAGDGMVLLRNGLTVMVLLNLDANAVSLIIGKPKNDPQIQKYIGLSKFDRGLIWDRSEGIFNKKYWQF